MKDRGGKNGQVEKENCEESRGLKRIRSAGALYSKKERSEGEKKKREGHVGRTITLTRAEKKKRKVSGF